MLEKLLDAGGGGDGEVDGIWGVLLRVGFSKRMGVRTDGGIGVGDDLC